MVPNTSELFPEPETPVNTVSRRLGSSTLTSLRLFARAPCRRSGSWLSADASCVSRVRALLVATLAQLLDADQVARGIAEGAVAHAVGLVRRLLDHLGAASLHP